MDKLEPIKNLVIKLYNLNFSTSLTCDTPRPWGIYFQDSASPQMEGIEELHNNILYYLAIIMFAVSWMSISIVKTYTSRK